MGLTRERLAQARREVLSRGGSRNADVLLVEGDGGCVVVKDFSPRGRFVRSRLGPWLLEREVRAYRQLEGMASVPRFLGWLDPMAIVLEYRPGELLSRRLAGRIPPGFVEELAATVEEMHRRGVVHLDLRHRSNLLAGIDGRPVLIDFASALVFDVSTRLGRRAVERLATFDRRALEKWRVRLT